MVVPWSEPEPRPATVTFEDLLGLGYAPRTAYLYARTLDKVVAVLDGRGVTLLTASAIDVARVAGTFRETHGQRSHVRSALAAAWDVLGRDNPPLRAVRVPPKPKTRCRALSEDAARKLEKVAWTLRDEDQGLAVLVGLYAGLRRAEIAALRWEDVGLDEHGRPAWLRVYGKGGLVADVPIHPVLAEVFARRRQAAGWVFKGRRRGAHAQPSTIWAWVREMASEAGLAHIPTHTLRHTALCEANDRSGDLRAVQEIARHARPETTAGYTRVTWQRMTQVVSMIDYGRRVDPEGVA